MLQRKTITNLFEFVCVSVVQLWGYTTSKVAPGLVREWEEKNAWQEKTTRSPHGPMFGSPPIQSISASKMQLHINNANNPICVTQIDTYCDILYNPDELIPAGTPCHEPLQESEKCPWSRAPGHDRYGHWTELYFVISMLNPRNSCGKGDLHVPRHAQWHTQSVSRRSNQFDLPH